MNRPTTGPAGSRSTLRVESDVANADGARTVTYGGSVAADAKPTMVAYRVPQPSRFAEILLAEALHERAIVVSSRPVEDRVDAAKLSAFYTPDRIVAERLLTIRPEGQFNTVVYEEENTYRGQDRRPTKAAFHALNAVQS